MRPAITRVRRCDDLGLPCPVPGSRMAFSHGLAINQTAVRTAHTTGGRPTTGRRPRAAIAHEKPRSPGSRNLCNDIDHRATRRRPGEPATDDPIDGMVGIVPREGHAFVETRCLCGRVDPMTIRCDPTWVVTNRRCFASRSTPRWRDLSHGVRDLRTRGPCAGGGSGIGDQPMTGRPGRTRGVAALHPPVRARSTGDLPVVGV